jgi:hypothetical protein
VIDVSGIPDGLVATPTATTRTRRGHVKYERLTLAGAAPPAQPNLDRYAPADLRWILSATRRSWPTIAARLGDRAVNVAADAARDGLVTIEITTTLDPRQGTAPLAVDTWVCWRRTDAATALHQRHANTADQARARLTDRAHAVADRIADTDAGLAEALRHPTTRAETLEALIFAAEDLADGATFDGPRAWSQHHYPHVDGDPSKHRDTIADLLQANGATPDTLQALGLIRASHIGIGGPITITTPDGTTLIAAEVAGIVTFNPDQPHAATVPPGRTAVVVENLQAAEAIARETDHAVIYTAGPPSDAALQTIASITRHATRTLLVPDADLGGVRIAARILAACPEMDLLDIGTQPHQRTRLLDPAHILALRQLVDGPAGPLAAAVLKRGYRLEQEHLTRAAVRTALDP